MKKLFLKAAALVLFIGACLAMTVSAYANSDIKLTYVGEGVTFSIYKTGALSSGGTFVPEEAFKNYNVDFEDESCALTLEIYIERDGIEPLMSAVTNSSSIVYFNDLPAGQYLILGEDVTIGNKVYTAQPVLTYIYDYSGSQIEIVGKYSSSDTSGGGGSTSVSVMKVWSGTKAESITAQLLKDGTVYDEITLNDSNNWRYTWDGLNDSSLWQVAEKDIPDGYTLQIDENGSVFILVNTEEPDEPDEPTTETTTEAPTETTTKDGGGSEPTTTEATTDTPTETTTKDGGGGGSDPTTETTTDSSSEVTTNNSGEDTETTTEAVTEDSPTETTTKKPSSGGGGGGGGSYYHETTTEATTSSSSDGDTEETTKTSSSSGGSDSSEPPDSDSSGGDSSDGGDDSTSSTDTAATSDDSSSDSGSDSSDDSASINNTSADMSSASVSPSSRTTRSGSSSSRSLPQTGQLWYPVPILLWLGIIFLILGIRRKSSNT